MIDLIYRFFRFIFYKCHRIKRMEVMTYKLEYELSYVPQWWFIWWHCYWHEIGYQYYIAYSYPTMTALRREWFGETVSKLDEEKENIKLEKEKLEVPSDD